MAASDKVRIQYASKYAGVSNYWKNSIGMSLGLEKLNVKAKKEAQEVLRQAELDARTIVSESETLQLARQKSSEIIRRAEDRSKELYHVANTYTEDALRRTEEAIQAALDEVRESRVRFRSASAEQMQVCQEKLKSDPTKQASED